MTKNTTCGITRSECDTAGGIWHNDCRARRNECSSISTRPAVSIIHAKQPEYPVLKREGQMLYERRAGTFAGVRVNEGVALLATIDVGRGPNSAELDAGSKSGTGLRARVPHKTKKTNKNMCDNNDRKYPNLIQQNFMDGQKCDDMARIFATSVRNPLKIAEYAVAAAYLRVHEGCLATETWMMNEVACSDGTIESIPSVIAARIACASYCVELVHHGWDDPRMESQDTWSLTKDADMILMSAWEASGEPDISGDELTCLLFDVLDESLVYVEAVLKPVMGQIRDLACKLVSTGVVTPAEIQQLASSAHGPRCGTDGE